jgi:hypothetical protein
MHEDGIVDTSGVGASMAVVSSIVIDIVASPIAANAHDLQALFTLMIDIFCDNSKSFKGRHLTVCYFIAQTWYHLIFTGGHFTMHVPAPNSAIHAAAAALEIGPRTYLKSAKSCAATQH